MDCRTGWLESCARDRCRHAGSGQKPTHLSNIHPVPTSMVSHMLTVLGRLAAALCVAVTLATTAFAQSRSRARSRSRPVSCRRWWSSRRATLTGFSIELWNAIAARLKLKTNYVPAPNVGALLEEVRSNKAEIGVAAISITAAREVEFEFSQPILNAGLQIMVRGGGKDGDSQSAVRPARAAVLEDQSGVARRRVAADPDPVAHHLVPGAPAPQRHHSERQIHPRHLLRDALVGGDARHPGGEPAAPMAGADRLGVLDVHRHRVRRALHRAARGDPDRPADPGRHQRPGRPRRPQGRDHPRQHRRQCRARAARAGGRGRADRRGLQGAQRPRSRRRGLRFAGAALLRRQ